MKSIESLLKAYQIKPSEVIPISNRVYKIHSHNYSFALKRSKLTMNSINSWKNVYRIANEHQLTSILPVYMTHHGEIIQQKENEFYYLTPWKEKREMDEPEHEVESLYHTLGSIHNQTKKQIKLDSAQIEQTVIKEKERIATYKHKLLSFVEKFEARHYMSPFELRVCMQYRDIEQVFKQIDYWYDYYLEDITNDGISYSSLCHGNLRSSHQIYHNSNTYLINWEHSFHGSPMRDLAIYFYHELKYHDSYLRHLTNSLPVYEKYNPLLQSEKSLLAIYLLNPYSYIQLLERYENNRIDKAHPFQIRLLEHSYRRLIQGLSLQGSLYESRQTIIDQQQESEN
ncbi:phosphotransferase [Aquibacillus saliphilus]|uniref:phosphotransferase n=1 Tax=Aquibacillus saliphilus TaxID=1909422 RepID=UPI001CF01EC6|nr:phosphotransferase [Aquibacillus saliphilus]